MIEPPNDQAAERSTLGACLLTPAVITEVAKIVKPEDFYCPKHQLIYQTVLDLTAEGKPADAVTVNALLAERGDTKKAGGAEYLATLIASPPTATAAPAYAKIVARLSRQRNLIELGERFKHLGYTETTSDGEVDALVAQADGFFRELESPSSSGLMFTQLIERWREWERDKTHVIATPWDELNQWIHGGVHKGWLVVVGGRPGDGKSNAGLNILLQAAEARRKSIAFSLEMGATEVASRMLAAGTYSPFGEIVGKRMTQETWGRVEEYISSHQDMPLEVVDAPNLTVEEVVAHCRSRKPEIIFVDYAQLVCKSSGKMETRDAVTHVTRSLKVAAKQLDMSVILASQLNRESTKKGLPQLTDLAESDAIGRDADIVLLLHRDPDLPGELKLILEKNRNGRTGVIELVNRSALARVG